MIHIVILGVLVPLALAQSGTIPAADGNLHVYALPIGQGDANVIQCPDGTLAIYDMGASNSASSQFWAAPELRNYLAGSMDLIENILVTHFHTDHYDLLFDTFPDLAELPNLQNIYTSCVFTDAPSSFQDWVNAIGAGSLMRDFGSGGGQCGAVGDPCETIDLCPNDPSVVTQVMGANLGQHCTDGGNKNTDCIVTKLMYGQFSILLPGDFEDEGTSESEDGPQKWMADFWGTELEVVVNQIAHHGAATNANKRIWTDTIKAPLVWSSGDAWYSYGHPRCEACENYNAFLCEPLVTDPASPTYCGDNMFSPQVQSTYTCGNDSSTFFQINDNTKGIYTTTPIETEMNLVDVASDGTRWGIRYQLEPATP